VAVEKGLFIKHGLDVEAIQIRSAVSLPALLGNEIQYMTSIGTGIRAAAKGVPIKVVLISRDAPLFFVVSRVKTIPDLRGKKIGVTGNPGSSTEVVTRLVLEHHGLKAGRDYAFVYGGDTTSVFATFRTGILDTISISLPFPIIAEKEGAHVLAKSSDVIRMASTGLAVRSAAINEQKQEIKQMIRADNEAREFIHRNKPETVKIIERWLEMDSVYHTLCASDRKCGEIFLREQKRRGWFQSWNRYRVNKIRCFKVGIVLLFSNARTPHRSQRVCP